MSSAARTPSDGVRYMLLSALFFSSMVVFVKLLVRRLPVLEIVFARSVVTLALSYVAVRRARVSPWGNRRAMLVLRGVLGLLGLTCYYYSVEHLPLADAAVIQYSSPIFTALIAAIVLRERFGTVAATATMIGFAGVLLVARPSFLFGGDVVLPAAAVAVGFVGAWFSACAYVVVRALRATDHEAVVVFYFPLVAALATAFETWRVGVMPRGIEWVWVLGLGVSTQLGQVYLTRGLHAEQAGKATAVTYVQVALAYVWGMLFFSEVPHGASLLGAALIASSTLLLRR